MKDLRRLSFMSQYIQCQHFPEDNLLKSKTGIPQKNTSLPLPLSLPFHLPLLLAL